LTRWCQGRRQKAEGASRVTVGRVERNVELDDDKLGFVASLDKNPQKSPSCSAGAAEVEQRGRRSAEVS